MRTFEIKSARDGVVLALGLLRDKPGGYYLAELRTRVVAGKVEVYDEPELLAAFFEGLAGLWWKGWEGERRYESLEGHLTIVGTRDALGHVFLDVMLRDAMGEAEYCVGARLVLEAGQLASISREAGETMVGAGRRTMRCG